MRGCFQPNFAEKRLKMTKSSKGCQSFRITAIALKLLAIILRLFTFGKSNLYLRKSGEIPYFSRAFERNTSK